MSLRFPLIRLILFLVVMTAIANPAADQARVLIVTGVDYPGHHWRETSPALKQILATDQRLDVRIVEDPHYLDSAALTNYAVVLLNFQNWEVPGPGVAARENLRRYVERGGGLMSVHFSCGAWHGEWPEFQNILGRVWHGAGPDKPQHDPRGRFTVRLVDADHSITRGLNDFETDDELYTCLTGTTPIHVLAEAKSKVDGKNHPMALVHEYGQGRVFVTTLGHDVKALTNSIVPQLLRRSCAWAARLPE
ncbi:MAG: ThuA domain-containing protein [Verrucomicrobiae bacterium]|nr:ThuA domain-containing protein [Verrucomicrobiae bacterium]